MFGRLDDFVQNGGGGYGLGNGDRMGLERVVISISGYYFHLSVTKT